MGRVHLTPTLTLTLTLTLTCAVRVISRLRRNVGEFSSSPGITRLMFEDQSASEYEPR